MHHNVRAENPQAEPLERYKTADVIGTLLCLQNHAEWARHDNERICVAVICPVSGNMKSSQPSYPITQTERKLQLPFFVLGWLEK